MFVVGCEHGSLDGDGIGVGDKLGAHDGMKLCRSGDNFKSIFMPKTKGFRPRFFEFDSVIISASCFSL